MNILSFDIEEWYIEKFYKGNEDIKYRAYDAQLDKILEALDSNNIKATFFCLGGLVEHFPYVVKKIAAAGHEIGSHSNHHRWINKMTPEEFREDTASAVKALEDCTGMKVRSFRAPAFSIGEVNKWAFEILYECGIENDASIFPGTRDFGGFPSFTGGDKPCRISYNGITVNEFPISIGKLPLVGKPIAYSGGGYFRLLSLGFVKNQIRNSDYTMCYFHILDILDFKSKLMTREEYERYFGAAGTLKNRFIRYCKSNLGRKRAFSGLTTLMHDFDFINVEKAAESAHTFPVITI
ncbi:MAG: polysaccharide deacetylase family protein [Muribaculaceae bacterium]|nr:polysaccharide deacetylase family protein [Muribaculaceae bacterium]